MARKILPRPLEWEASSALSSYCPLLPWRKASSTSLRKREERFAKWLNIYNEKMLSQGEYLGSLYDIGFDKPETHAIRKGDSLYYAFFARRWKGTIAIRGLEPRTYKIVN